MTCYTQNMNLIYIKPSSYQTMTKVLAIYSIKDTLGEQLVTVILTSYNYSYLKDSEFCTIHVACYCYNAI
jgi:hypothetical protein